jgi:hypothetical protein
MTPRATRRCLRTKPPMRVIPSAHAARESPAWATDETRRAFVVGNADQALASLPTLGPPAFPPAGTRSSEDAAQIGSFLSRGGGVRGCWDVFPVDDELAVDDVGDRSFEAAQRFCACLAVGEFAFVVVPAGAGGLRSWVTAAMCSAWLMRRFPARERRWRCCSPGDASRARRRCSWRSDPCRGSARRCRPRRGSVRR